MDLSGTLSVIFKKEFSAKKISHLHDCLLDENKGNFHLQSSHKFIGYLYVSHSKGIIRIHLKLKKCMFIGGSKNGHKDGTFDKVLFNQPFGMTLLNEHTLLVCDSGNRMIRSIDFEQGIVSTLCGHVQQQTRSLDGDFSKSTFHCPKKISSIPSLGVLFVTDSQSLVNSAPGKIRIVDMNISKIFTFVDQELQSPQGIVARVARHDNSQNVNLFIADSVLNCIAHFVLQVAN